MMDVFKYRDAVIADYKTFTTSFTKILATDIEAFIKDKYEAGQYWPAPLIQLNPSFVPGRTVEQLCKEDILHPRCQDIFRFGRDGRGNPGVTALLHKHQQDALKIAQQRESYVLTTGTGSGKSLSYILPIVDAVLKRKGKDNKPSIKAIIIYPMNALVNSQMEELDKYFKYYDGNQTVTYGRYTGQEKEEERQKMAANPPDIILTNFMMLELLMTRQGDLDRTVIGAAQGLEFLVLDELHTYRGRQGGDVAMLVRRVREALNPDLLCIGTSATMASEGLPEERKVVVATVASKLFGAEVKPSNIVTETLQPLTSGSSKPGPQILAEAINRGIPRGTDFQTLREHPVSCWIELTLGLKEEEGKWVRNQPQYLQWAAEQLAQDSGLDKAACEEYLREFLLCAHSVVDEKGKPLFAFRLHQFVSGANTVFSTFAPFEKREFDLSGQAFRPGNRNERFYSLHFCRQCGQEYHPVWLDYENGEKCLSPRGINERNREGDDLSWGFYMFDPKREWNEEDFERYPERWVEVKKGELKLKAHTKNSSHCQLTRCPPEKLATKESSAGSFPAVSAFASTVV